ncbi:DNA repair protein RecO [Candidatus Poribacteria bacterium]|nr:DNA repair protein RecO [Candidatus Poribacteria bacterium]
MSLLVSTEAIVLKTIDYGEGHKIVIFYTLEYGKLKIVVKGAKSSKNKFGASLEPMTLSRIVFYNHPARDLQMISQSDLIASHANLRKDLLTMSWGLYVMELVDELTIERDINKPIFFLLKNLLETLSKTNSLKIVIKYFELKFFLLCGYALQLKNCVICSKIFDNELSVYYLDINKGGVVCGKCKNKSENILAIRVETWKILNMLANISIEKVGRLTVSNKAQDELESIINFFRMKYISKELKSLKFIREIKI